MITYAASPLSASSNLKRPNGPTAQELELLELTNQERSRKGLQPLKMNGCLMRIARDQSANMAFHHRLSHTAKGKSFAARIKKARYSYRRVGENVARSKHTFPHVMRMWMKSHGHRSNILNPQFQEIGIGITTSSNGDQYFAQVFGAPRSEPSHTRLR